MARKKIGAMLEEKGFINEFQLVAALSHQRKWKTKLGQSLIELGYLEEVQLYEVLAAQLELEYVDLRKLQIPPEILRRVTKEYAREWLAVPIAFDGATWTVAMTEPDKPNLVPNLSATLNGKVKLVLATPMALENLTRKIPDKMAVGTVQPVKKAFFRDSSGNFVPAPPLAPEPEPKIPPPQDDDHFLDQPRPPLAPEKKAPGLTLPPLEAAPPEDEFLSAPDLPPLESVPADDGALSLEQPEPSALPGDNLPPVVDLGSAPGPSAADVPLDIPDLEEPPAMPAADEPLAMPDGDDEIPLEPAYESAYRSSADAPEAEIEDLPLETPYETASALSEPGADAFDTISLDDLLPPPLAESAEEKPAAAAPAPSPFAELLPPSLETGPGLEVEAPLLDLPPLPLSDEHPPFPPVPALPDTASMEETPGPSFASMPEFAPPADETEEALELAVPPLLASADEAAEPAAAAPDLADLDLPPLLETIAPAAAPSVEAPPLDDLFPPLPFASALEPPAAAEEPPSLDLPPLADLGDEVMEVPGPPPEAAAAPNGIEEFESISAPEPAPPAETEADDENTIALMERIKAVEAQIQGMTVILDGLKDMLNERKGKKPK